MGWRSRQVMDIGRSPWWVTADEAILNYEFSIMNFIADGPDRLGTASHRPRDETWWEVRA